MIIVKISGGLGCQLSQYAFGLACAQRLGVTLKLDTTYFLQTSHHRFSLDSIFSELSIEASINEIELVQQSAYIMEETPQFDAELTHQVPDSAYLEGYWFDYRYSQDVLDSLRSVLRHDTNQDASAYFCVYLEQKKSENEFSLPITYYKDSIKLLQRTQAGIPFVIFSDDEKFAKEHFSAVCKLSKIENIKSFDAENNLFLSLLGAKGYVVGNDSLSIWAARLSAPTATVVYPSQYYRKDGAWLQENLGCCYQPEFPDAWQMINADVEIGYDKSVNHSLIREIPGRHQNLATVSVIIPTKNRPGLLANALESLCYQTFKDFEVVVHNDGGCDVGDIIAYYQDRLRIVYLRSPQSGGAAASRNKALKLASGRIIAYLDDDDIYLDAHLERVVNALNNSDELFVYTGAEYVIQQRIKGRLVDLHRENVFDSYVYDRERLLVNNFIPTPTWAHRASLLEYVGGFNERLTILEDWDFLLHASRFSNFKCIKEVTVEIRNDKSRNDHTLRSCESNFIAFHEEIYRLHPSDNPEVKKARKRFLADLERKQKGLSPVSYDYEQWVEALSPTELTAQIHAERMMLRWPSRYQFNLLMVVGENDFDLLSKTIDSLCEQLYKHWRLIVVSDQPIPDASFEDNETLGWLTIDSLDAIDVANALNGIIEAIPADWATLIEPGTKLDSTTLLKVGDRLLLNPTACIIYTDHDEYTPEDVRVNPAFKPDFNYDLLRSEDYIGNSIFFRTEQLALAGGFQPYQGAQNYEATFRVVEMFGKDSVSHVPFPLMTLPISSTKDHTRIAASQVAIESHLARLGIKAEVASGYIDGTYQVFYRHELKPMVSIIIPNKNKLEFLAPCIDSLFEKTDYTNFEVIIVDNRSTDPDLFEYYDALLKQYPGRVQIVNYDAPFNFAHQCNIGADLAKGEYLLMLNNDMEIIQPQWLDRMLEHALREEVGVVGAKLMYPETAKLQHAGVVLGCGHPEGLAHHTHLKIPMEKDAMLNRTKVVQNYCAVTAACLMIQKELYSSIGGMDAENFSILFNDVDLCLRVSQLGKSVVWTPFASLIHHAHKSLDTKHDDETYLYLQKKTNQERKNFSTKWLSLIANDPNYHPLLSKVNVGDQWDTAFVVPWDNIPDSRPKMMALPLSGGSGEYRIQMPLRVLDKAALAQHQAYVSNSHPRLPMLSEMARNNPDVFIIQNALASEYEKMLAIYGEYLPSLFRVQMLDDLLSDIPKDSSMHRHFQKHWKDAKSRLRNTLKHCDRLIVSTQPLKDFAKDMIEDIIVMPNMLEKSVWGTLVSKRKTSKKPRVGWVGAQQHGGDLALIFDVVKATASEVDWVFQGMCPEEIRPYVKEWNTDWLPINKYPEAIAKLNLDLAIAPLEVNPFNEAKSNLRLLEYGALGWPVICTDIYPYQENNAPVCRVPNEVDAWISAIKEHIADLTATAKKGDQLKVWVHKHYMIEDHAQEWLAALTPRTKKKC